MILELDAGNSRIKWRFVENANGGVFEQGLAANAADLARRVSLTAGLHLIRVSSVRSQSENTAIANWAADSRVSCRFARVERSWGPVRNQYADVSRLGIDRWLAMVAAYMRAKSACMIVDAGTALTVDVVDKSGLHLGGYILPGLGLMKDCLQQRTGIRLQGAEESRSTALGNSTGEAVSNGVNAAAVGAIRAALNELGPAAGTAKLYVSGGSGPVLQAQLGNLNPEITQDLVFEGLALVCPGDETD